MLSHEFAEHFAREWVEAWNAHDLERILSHYREDFRMASPRIAVVAGEPSGVLHGKAAIRAYWARALALQPQLRFELLHTLVGADSLVLVYRGPRGLTAEHFEFDERQQVIRASAHALLAPGV